VCVCMRERGAGWRESEGGGERERERVMIYSLRRMSFSVA
jgi:hypothetical protein